MPIIDQLTLPAIIILSTLILKKFFTKWQYVAGLVLFVVVCLSSKSKGLSADFSGMNSLRGNDATELGFGVLIYMMKPGCYGMCGVWKKARVKLYI